MPRTKKGKAKPARRATQGKLTNGEIEETKLRLQEYIYGDSVYHRYTRRGDPGALSTTEVIPLT